ncbi:MAG: hypothetical protein LH616_08945, partial [Ilumatobacteraceae bacterium]|nr:hypothetical protein [Ilumatobacteraceae bacterium]
MHAVVFGIGAIDSRSLIVADRRASFPEDCLPDGPLTLTAVLIVEGSVTGTVAFELPDTGASDWQNLALPVGTSEGVTNAELAIYHHAALIHLVCIAAPVGGPADRGGPTADVRFQ